MKHGILVTCLFAGHLGLVGCESPSDVIYDPPPFTPIEEQAGLYRVTSGEGEDVVRGFLPDGRLLIRARNLPPFGADWVLISVPPSGGQVREEMRVYRPAVLDDMAHLTTLGAQRVLVLWKAAMPGIHGCPDSSLTSAGVPGPAPRTPSPVGFALFALPDVDGTPVAAIPSRFVSTNSVEGVGTITQRVRVNPVLRDVDRTGANAFGPVILPGTGDLVYSDGDSLWRASITDTSAAPQLLGIGAYPVLSPDARALAYSRPTMLDSTVRRFTIPLGLAFCVEEHVEISAAAWELVVRDLETGAEQVVADALDPVFDPRGGRLAVRVGAELRWLDRATGETTPIVGTAGGFNPVFSADGGILAFSRLNDLTNSDAYFIRIPH